MVAALTQCSEAPAPDVTRDDLTADIEEARAAHLSLLERLGVYKWVPLAAATSEPLPVRWVDRTHRYPIKARLMTRGYEQRDTDDADFYAATPTSGALKTLLAIAAWRGWSVGIADSEHAFLQAELPAEDAPIFGSPPPE